MREGQQCTVNDQAAAATRLHTAQRMPVWRRTCICSTRPSLPQNSSTVGSPDTSSLRLSACGGRAGGEAAQMNRAVGIRAAQ